MGDRRLVAALGHCLVIISTVFALGCAQAPAPQPDSPSLEPALQQLVGGVVQSNEVVRGMALHVDSPLLGLSWEGAAGLADPQAGEPMTTDHPVRIASNTKTFVAATVLRLVEQRSIRLDDPIAGHLPDEYVALLSSGGYAPDQITVRHLLTHTSGLFDHTNSEKFEERILNQPNHHWTRMEQVTGAMQWGEAWGAPGEVYHYSDTGYVLLGGIIEHATGEPLAGAVRRLIGFERLGLRSTWWETVEYPPAGLHDRAHQFLADLDTHAFDPSLDLYGGGGIVCTVGDLARFHRAVFTGDVYDDQSTVDTMLTTIDGVSAAADASDHSLAPGAYRMGLWVADTEGYTGYWHTGYWGTIAVYTPELDLTIAATLNQNSSREPMRELVRQVVRLAADAAALSEP